MPWILLMLVVWGLLSPTAQAQPPSCDTPEYRQLDFWLGEWEMRDRASGTLLGTAKVEKINGGCGLREDWRSVAGPQGSNFSSFDVVGQKWRMASVLAQGPLLFSEGQFANGQIVFVGQSPRWWVRITWGVMAGNPNQVKQTWENSTDGGKTWIMTFDGLCLKR